MLEITRRDLLLGAVAASAALRATPANATLMRGLSLSTLVRRSQRVVVLEPVDAVCRHVDIGGRRSIATDTQVRVHESWRGAADVEIILRTLGGRLGGLAELVHGQPVLELGVRAVTFIKLGRDGQTWWTTGMAQGHFPLTDARETARLQTSRGLSEIVSIETSAVRQLVGKSLTEARELVRGVGQP